MKIFIVLAATFLAVNALSLHEQWKDFKIKHGKSYKNIAEETARFEIFQQNLKTIKEHNAKYAAGLTTYWKGINQFTDITNEEFEAIMNKQTAGKPKFAGELHIPSETEPEEIDWRTKGAVLEVQNQGDCGSCWAFSTTGSLEGQNAIKNGKKIPLSAQQLIDCTLGRYGNYGCVGGYNLNAFKYIVDQGIQSEESYKYQQVTSFTCKANSNETALRIKSFKLVGDTTEALKNAVGTVGPISVGIISSPDLKAYSGGIYDAKWTGEINHEVVAVGYGENPVPYWILKNSWGESWGEKGFFRAARANNLTGIANQYAAYPVLD